MSNGIYDILGKLAALTPKEEPKQSETQKVYESVEAKGSILEGVSAIEKKLAEDYASMGIGGMGGMGVVGEDTNSKLADQIAQLLAKGNKVDSRVVGAMGHIVRAEGTHITLAKLNKPTSKVRYSWMITPQRAEGLEIVQAGPKHYVVKDTDAAWGEPQQSLDLDEDPMGNIEGGTVAEVAAPGQEDWIKKNKKHFIDQYGKDKGLEVLYATAWKRSKQDESVNKAETDNFTIDDIKELEGIRDLATIKARAKELIKGKPARRMKPEKISWFYNHIDTLKNPMAVVKMMYDLLLAGEGHKVIGSRNSMGANSYRQRFGEDAEMCPECGMNEAECTCVHEASDYGWDNPEEKKPTVRKITGKYGTEYQGDPEDDVTTNGDAGSGKKGRGRPRKHAIKPKKTDGNGNKLGRGRPKKASSTFSAGGLAAALGMGAAPKKHGKGRVHRMDESRMLDETGESLNHILNRFKSEVKAFEQGQDLDQDLYDALYDYYVDIAEMPYGVQKARTGDPYNWVTDKLDDYLISQGVSKWEGVEEEAGGMGAASVAAAPVKSLEEEMAELVELAKLAGIETEGNAFTDKLKSTPKGGEFELDGEVYTDTSNLDEADVEVSEPAEAPVNAPKKKYFSMKGSTMNPGEGDFGEKQMNPDRPTFKNGDNALSRPPVRESLLDKLAAEYESIKKVSK